MNRNNLIFLMGLLFCLPVLYLLPLGISAAVSFFVVLFLQKEPNGHIFWTTGIAGGICWLPLIVWQDKDNISY